MEMTREEISNGNKLIAEFMGNKMNGPDYYISGHNANFPTTDLIGPSDLAYHESWDWIMPVVMKMYKQTDHVEIHFQNYILYCKSEAAHWNTIYNRGEDAILNIFKTCVDTIKNINEHYKKT